MAEGQALHQGVLVEHEHPVGGPLAALDVPQGFAQRRAQWARGTPGRLVGDGASIDPRRRPGQAPQDFVGQIRQRGGAVGHPGAVDLDDPRTTHHPGTPAHHPCVLRRQLGAGGEQAGATAPLAVQQRLLQGVARVVVRLGVCVGAEVEQQLQHPVGPGAGRHVQRAVAVAGGGFSMASRLLGGVDVVEESGFV